MPINLVNEKDFNDYICDVVYRGEKADVYTAGNFKSIDYVIQNKDKIVKSMVFQWAKHRLRSYVDENPKSFLSEVEKAEGYPVWVKKALHENKKVWRFQAENVSDGFRGNLQEVCDFLYAMADAYVRKQVGKAKGSKEKYDLRLRIDYLKTTNEYNCFEKVKFLSDKWHEMLRERSAKKQLNPKQNQRLKALEGTQNVLSFNDGMSIVKLLTAEALDFESDCMGHCVGRGSYDADVLNGRIEIFSLRDEYNLPHATIKIKNGKLRQCKGRGNFTVNSKYISYIQSFVEQNGYEIISDMKNVGLIKKNGKYYNLFDLPKDEIFMIYGDLDLSDMKLKKLPNLSNVSVMGDFDCSSNCLEDLNGLPKRAKRLLCGNNHIREISSLPEGVEVVFCQNNLLSELPVFSEQIKEVFCGGNRLEKLSIQAQGLRCLEVGNNHIKQIDSLPEGLRILDCSWNELECLENLPNSLRVLRCDNNQLKGLGNLPKNLEELDCENNLIKSLENVPAGIKLRCNGNPLVNFAGQVKMLIARGIEL